jgi:hypothetical protein
MLMAYHAVDIGQVDPQTQHECSKHGPVVVAKLIGNYKSTIVHLTMTISSSWRHDEHHR